ncbi:MAG TPA: TIGR03857 family LLM class F420-dependent oxidoreductase, partial [Acidimicrobiia bacterium]|nr:TIGR03857 family LLM class F420-dependent oxidoreductase [Acidimicrobiia bacterium]
VRKAAEEAGRDPDSVALWSCLVVACEADEDRMLETIVRRLTTYVQLPDYGELICAANGWDPAVLARLRSHPVLDGRVADTTTFTSDELRVLRDSVYPAEWLAASATGTADQCAGRIIDQLEQGATGVLLHGSSPDELAAVLAAYEARGR